ncbi:MAG TPA: Ig-like domain-containing protein [Thermoanaerobaculia bacterium]|nr:Ig-like domain-containing protein [Thermoanaerobaculia bacterium]
MPRSLPRLLLFTILGVLVSAAPLAAATRTWTGTASTQWSNAGNWGGTAPSTGDDLVFPAGGANQSTVNDYAAGTLFNSITISGSGYTLGGNAIILGAGGLTSSATDGTINLTTITLGASQTWTTPTLTSLYIVNSAVQLNGNTLTFDDASSSVIVTVNGVISGTGAIVKNLGGILELNGVNTYAGPTTVNAGYLDAGSSTAAGVADGIAANGTTVNAGASFAVLNGVTLGNEWITVTGFGQSNNGALQNGCGTAVYNGPVVISGSILRILSCGPGGATTFNGAISGGATTIEIVGSSPLTFTNSANSFTGNLVIQTFTTPFTVNIGANNAIPAGVTVDVETNETLALNNFNDTIAGLAGDGNVSLGSGTLTIAGTTTGTFSGAISGTGNLVLSGAQTLSLTGANTATGTLTDMGSGLVISGAGWPGPVMLNNGSSAGLSNSTTIGPLTVTNSQVTPGGGGTGIANTGNLTFLAGAQYHVLLNGTTAGSFSRLNVTGTVSLGGAQLIVTPGATFPAGTQFIVIDNDGVDAVTGTFGGLGNGATFAAGGQNFTVSYTGGTGNDVVLTAAGTTTTTTLLSSANPSTFGQNVTFTATVSPNGGVPTPTGTVSFFNGATLMGSSAVNGAGVATFSTNALTLGLHQITGVYSGDANFTGGTSSPLPQQVNQASTTTGLTSSANPSTAGQSVTFTATVTPANGGAPTGTVSFYDGVTLLGSGTLNGAGVATFFTSTLAVGPHSITATYNGDTNFTGSTSALLSQAVNSAVAVPALDARALAALALLLAIAGAWWLKR